MPVDCERATVLPSADTNTPSTPLASTKLMIAVERARAKVIASGRVLLTPDDFGIPHRRCFTPTELAPHFYVCPKTIIRMIEDDLLVALPMRENGEYKIPYVAVEWFFLRQQLN